MAEASINSIAGHKLVGTITPSNEGFGNASCEEGFQVGGSVEASIKLVGTITSSKEGFRMARPVTMLFLLLFAITHKVGEFVGMLFLLLFAITQKVREIVGMLSLLLIAIAHKVGEIVKVARQVVRPVKEKEQSDCSTHKKVKLGEPDNSQEVKQFEIPMQYEVGESDDRNAKKVGKVSNQWGTRIPKKGRVYTSRGGVETRQGLVVNSFRGYTDSTAGNRWLVGKNTIFAEGNIQKRLAKPEGAYVISMLRKLAESEIHKKVEQVRPPDNSVDKEEVKVVQVPMQDNLAKPEGAYTNSKLGKLGKSEIHKEVEQVRPPDNSVDKEEVEQLKVPMRDKLEEQEGVL